MAEEIKIERLEGKDRVRIRPEVMLGSANLRGAQHTFTEMLGNSLDEASSGHGTRIDIRLNPDFSMQVRDYGRGVPLGWNEKEQAWNYWLIYEELYAGSKYDNNQGVLENITPEQWKSFKFEDYDGLASVGLNGLGAASTQYSSEFFKVRSIRNGVCTEMQFEKGESIWDEPKVYDTDEANGTEVTWKPDDEVFNNDTKVPESWTRRQAENVSVVASLDIHFTGQDGNTEIFKASSIEEFLGNLVENVVYGRNIVHARDPQNRQIVVSETKVAIGPAGDGTVPMRFYQNFVEVKRGVHEEALFRAFEQFFARVGNEKKVRLKPVDFEGLLTGVVSTRSTKVSFSNQTKDSVNNDYIYDGIYDTVNKTLLKEQAKGTPWLVEIGERAIEIAQNRQEAEEIRKRVSTVAKKISSRKTLPEKFVSCQAYDRKNFKDVEFWICEGNSAAGSVKDARDGVTQSILPIRGKGLNLYKATVDRLLANKEISDIMQVLGTGIDLGDLASNKAQFDIKKLRVGKIIFASDADKDGYHIRMLLTVLFWRLFPQLLEDGYIYVAETPIFGIKSGRGYSHYFYTEAEWEEWTSKNGTPAEDKIQRFKGLGEVDADVLAETTVLPGKRRLIQIKVDPQDPKVLDTLAVLFGSNTDSRKKAILSQMMHDNASFEDVMMTLSELADEAAGMDIEDVREYQDVII